MAGVPEVSEPLLSSLGGEEDSLLLPAEHVEFSEPAIVISVSEEFKLLVGWGCDTSHEPKSVEVKWLPIIVQSLVV